MERIPATQFTIIIIVFVTCVFRMYIKAVQVVTMFMKGKGPEMPQKKTMIKELKKLSLMWEKTFDKLIMMPFEKDDWKVNFILS